ncbi:MAG: beta-ketoacyl-[acyl-carrier-protein] synthase family protein [Arenicellales bacterium]|nr:beta-ketoacyl-[acyl-carrier-protein] synthase family protein [Arenicellales bacterium]
MKRRVVVTGLGIFSSIGSNIQEFWDSCLNGRSRVEKIPEQWLEFAEYKSSIWSPLPDFNGRFSRADILHYDPVSLISFITAWEALESAGFVLSRQGSKGSKWEVEGLDTDRTGVYMGTGLGGGSSLLSNFSHHSLQKSKIVLTEICRSIKDEAVENAMRHVLTHMMCAKRFSPFVVSKVMPNAVSAVLGVKFAINGPNNTYSIACASSTIAIGKAYEAVRTGEVDTAITGGSEYAADDYGAVFRGYDMAGTLAHTSEDSFSANRPFDKRRSGFLYSQGGSGVLILEDYETASARGARIMGEIIGFEQTFDAHSMMSIEEGGLQIERMIKNLLEKADVSAQDVGYLNAHGTGTMNNDRVEADVIQRLFHKSLWVNSTKSLLGHTLGASGAIEAIVTVLTLANQVTHICKNLENPISNLNFVRKSSQAIKADIGLSQSFAFGGHNAALLFRRSV